MISNTFPFASAHFPPQISPVSLHPTLCLPLWQTFSYACSVCRSLSQFIAIKHYVVQYCIEGVSCISYYFHSADNINIISVSSFKRIISKDHSHADFFFALMHVTALCSKKMRAGPHLHFFVLSPYCLLFMFIPQ